MSDFETVARTGITKVVNVALEQAALAIEPSGPCPCSCNFCLTTEPTRREEAAEWHQATRHAAIVRALKD